MGDIGILSLKCQNGAFEAKGQLKGPAAFAKAQRAKQAGQAGSGAKKPCSGIFQRRKAVF